MDGDEVADVLVVSVVLPAELYPALGLLVHLGLVHPKLWVQTVGIATLWTGLSDFCNYDTAIIPHFLCILLNVCPG